MAYYQTYGTQYENHPQQYLYQNYGYQERNFGTSAFNSSNQTSRTNQAAATVPLLTIPRRTIPIEQSQFIIVHPSDDLEQNGCCGEMSVCRCVDWFLTGVCYIILILVFFSFLFGVVVFFIQNYRNH